MRACWPTIGCALALGLLTAAPAAGQGRSAWEAARQRMVQTAVIDAGVTNPRVIEAMRSTPRHEFVPAAYRRLAYEDMALPIGDQQTISAPYIVAFMTEALDPQPTDRVLEIGTGSGYQAAVLSSLVQEVYTIEIVETLGRTAERTLESLGYAHVHVRIGDGFQGWPEHAPFDKIIVTCSPESVPEPLVDQLREGGLMIIPVGQRYQQVLYLMRKREGQLEAHARQSTLFVPMTGAAEEARQVQPDPAAPVLENGGFEKELLDSGSLPDWYYQRQLERVEDATAPEGRYCIVFRNTEPGRPAIVMQGMAVDGRYVTRLEVSAWARCERIRAGRDADEQPTVAITFYDQNRAPLGTRTLGPLRGPSPWHQYRAEVRVPPAAREAILRLGLFGAVGQIAFDDVRVRALARGGPAEK